jgi:branched-chain amino acid transport system permease protein
MLSRLSIREVLPFCIFLCTAAFFQMFVGKSEYLLRVGTLVLLWALWGIGWNITGGYVGMFSLGHAAFIGAGAYTSSLMFYYLGVSPWIGMVVGALIAAVMGVLFGFVIFRLKLSGLYFSIMTLAFAEVIRALVLNLEVTKGAKGLFIPVVEASLRHFQFKKTAPYYYIILGFVLFAMLFVAFLERNKLGEYFVAIREDEEAAEAIGINTFRYKLIAMAISCVIMAVGGTFYAQNYLYVEPDLLMTIGMSVQALLVAIFGGAGTVWGPIVGSLAVTIFGEVARVTMGATGGIDLVMYGLALIAVVWFMPQGIVRAIGFGDSRPVKRAGKKFPLRSASEGKGEVANGRS